MKDGMMQFTIHGAIRQVKRWGILAALSVTLVFGVVRAAEINDVSTTDASNTVRWSENMAPSSVNDSARALEGILARWHKDVSGGVSAYGTGDAISVTPNRTISAYYDGLMVAFQATAANTGATTLRLGSLSTVPVRKHFDAALAANDIKTGQRVVVIYDNVNTYWQMVTGLGNSPGTVTSVTAADTSILAGGTATAVTLRVGDSGVTAGTYKNADVTVNATGRITSAATGTESFIIACSNETTTLTSGNNKVRFRMPYALTLTEVRAALSLTSSSGAPQFDINESGTSVLSTKLFIDQGESTSTTAATPAVISDSALANDAEMSIDIDSAGTGAAGCKITLLGTKT